MTARVVDCRPQPTAAPPAAPLREGPQPAAAEPHSRVGHTSLALTGCVLLGYAAVNGYLRGWLVAVFAMASLIWLYGAAAGRVRWGWLSLIFAAALVMSPRPDAPLSLLAFLGCLWLWWRSRWALPAGRRTPLSHSEHDRQMAQLAGRHGELHVGAVLAHELPDGFMLLNGLKLPRGAGDIDHLVVGPTGVFLLES